MRSTARLAVLCALLCGITAARILCADSAECTGVVADETGEPLAAAKIMLQSSTGLTFRTETDGAGRFILRDIPAGDYNVEARKEGFFVLAGESLNLRPGPNEVTLTLKHAEELHEQVQVTAPASQIDAQDTGQRETITAREIRDIPLPNSHIFHKILPPLPGPDLNTY